jgi:lysophospholipase L1-like esterase
MISNTDPHQIGVLVNSGPREGFEVSVPIEVNISQLIRYSRACAQYSDFLGSTQLLTQKLLKQGYIAPRLKSWLQTFYGRHHNLVDRYKISISQMTMDLLLYI